jgi:hypothetical protein
LDGAEITQRSLNIASQSWKFLNTAAPRDASPVHAAGGKLSYGQIGEQGGRQFIEEVHDKKKENEYSVPKQGAMLIKCQNKEPCSLKERNY